MSQGPAVPASASAQLEELPSGGRRAPGSAFSRGSERLGEVERPGCLSPPARYPSPASPAAVSGKPLSIPVCAGSRRSVLRERAERGSIPAEAGVSGIRCLAARQYPDVEIAVLLEEEGDGAAWEYEIAFHQDKQRRPRIRRERVNRGEDPLGPDRGPGLHVAVDRVRYDRWRPDIAARRAESLRRAVACLQRLSSA